MELSQEQIRAISSSILVSDIIEYINRHPKEYAEFLENENK